MGRVEMRVKPWTWILVVTAMLFSPAYLFAEEFDPTGIYQTQGADACSMAIVEIYQPTDNVLVSVKCWKGEVDLNTNYRRPDIVLEGLVKNFEYEPFSSYLVQDAWDESGENNFAIKFYPEDGMVRIDSESLADTLLLGKNTGS